MRGNEAYLETIRDYDKGVEWHARKSRAYVWKPQIGEFVEMLPGNRVLDAGCGTGRDVKEFLQRGIQVEGLDYSKKTIAFCKKRFPKTRFYLRDVRKTNLPDGAYDGIWACAVLLNLFKSDVRTALKEFYRLLTPKGLLFASVKAGTGDKMVSDQAGERLFSFYQPLEFKQMVKQAGFRLEKSGVIDDWQKDKPRWICVYARKTVMK